MTERKPLNPWLIFGLICIPIFIGSVDLTSIVVVLPQATLDLLGTKGLNKADQALWAVTAYLLAYTISLALVGRLSDVLPRKRIFLTCLVIFIIGSIWAGVATEFPLTVLKMLPIWPDPDVLPLISLVIGRVIQAIGAGASVSVGMALVSDIFPPEHRAEPISLIGAIDSLGWVVGNLYAGLMLQILPSWRWLFLINAGVAILALILTFLALRRVPINKSVGRFDLRGAILFALALILLTLGIEAIKDSPSGIWLLAACAALLILFIWLQFRTRNALFDMRFIRQREVRVALITNLIIGFSLILMVAGVPLVINLLSVFLRGEGLLTGALRAGIMLCALTLPLIVAVIVGESRYRRIGAAVPVSIGLLLAIIGFLSANFWTYTAPNYVIALPLSLVGVGLGLTIGPLSLVVVDAAEASARGLASSLVLMMRLLGMTFGTPLAAALTLKLANDWATERVENMGSFHDIARSMLIPPMATDALARVMLAGAAMCGVGLIAFYLPRLRRAVQAGLGLSAVLRGAAALITVLVIVGLLALGDSITTPTILHNPIARQLPPNVEFYAALNIQQVFLQNTRRPLEAVIKLLMPPSAPQPAQSGPASSSSSQTGTSTSGESPISNLMRALFRTNAWTDDSFKAFCTEDLPRDQWQDCFANSLLSWIGPQAAFALLPRTHTDFDYVFAFQATNRNNAIQFASNLASALGEKEPAEAGPNIRILTINAGKPNEQRLAITEAYVLIGTPKAVQYTLNHGNISLADQPDYQTITAELPAEGFATFYVRSNNFDSDLRPALLSIFRSPIMENIMQTGSRLSELALTRTSTAPTLLGLALRVDEQHLSLNAVANFPYSMDKFNAQQVSQKLLAMIPDKSRAWAAANFNIAGIAREINISDLLSVLARTGSDELRGLLTNPLTQGFITGLGRSLQNILTHARGEAMVITLPTDNNLLIVLPLEDKDTAKAAAAVQGLKSQLQLLSLSGMVSLNTQTIPAGEIVSVGGQALEAVIPGGFQYILTADNFLIMGLSGHLADSIQLLGTNSIAASQIANAGFDPANRFLYFFADRPDADSTVAAGGQIKHQAFYLDAVLQTPR